MRKFALLLLVAPLALAACGGSSHSIGGPPHKFDPVAYVRHAASATAQLASEHMTMAGTVEAAGQKIAMNGTGDFANSPVKGTLDLSFSAAGTTGTIDEVIDGTIAYVSSPLFSRALPSGKSWMKLDLEKFGKTQGVDFSALMSQSPAQSLQRLEAAGSVSSIGAETIDGVETTHFRVTNLDVSKIPGGAAIESMTHATYGPIDVWIGNKDGYVRKESVSASYTASGVPATVSMTMSFSSFGEHVSLQLPPASKTFDATGAAIQGLTGH